uniref:Uncharacterized protein n=1 Tax=Anopheles minimus TaxID=112268 RepID=A0A182WQ75_9DIPT
MYNLTFFLLVLIAIFLFFFAPVYAEGDVATLHPNNLNTSSPLAVATS